jgi:tetratricopeptide (TPR) repeat protein
MNYIYWNVMFSHLGRKGNREGQLAHAREMAALFPGHPEAHLQLAMALSRHGYVHEAVEAGRAAVSLDPEAPGNHTRLATWLYLARDYEGSADEASITDRLRPGEGLEDLALALAELGRYAEARAALDSLEAMVPVGYLPRLNTVRGYVLAHAGDRAEAAAIAAELDALPDEDRWRTLEWRTAVIYGRLGDVDRAFELLERGNGGPSLVLDPRWDPLRDDPRFEAAIRDRGLEWVAANAASE